MLLLDEEGNYLGLSSSPPPSEEHVTTDASIVPQGTGTQPGHPQTSPTPPLTKPKYDPTASYVPPEPSLPTPAEDLGLDDYLTDMGKGAVNGLISAAQETGQFMWDVADFATGDTLLDDTAPGYEWAEGLKFHTQTQAGKITEGIVNIGAGIIGAGKFLKAAKLLQGAGKAALVGRGFASGALADALVLDPLEDRLSNFIEEFPLLSNPISEALAAKPDDSRWEGRFKNACEGLVAGAAFEVLFAGIKVLRGAAKAGNNRKALEDSLDHTLPELEKAQAKLEGGNHVPTPPDASASPPATKAGTSPSYPKAPEMNADALWKEVQASGTTYKDMMQRVSEVLNSRNLSILTEEGIRLHEILNKKIFDQTTLGKGAKTLEDLTGDSLKHFRDVGIDTTKIEESLASVAKNSQEAQAMREGLFTLRCAYDTVVQGAAHLGLKISKHTATQEEIATHQVMMQFGADLYLTIKNASTEAGRSLAALRRMAESFEGGFVNGTFTGEAAIQAQVRKGRLQSPDKWLKLLQDANFADVAGNPRAMTSLMNAVTSRKIGDYFTEWYLNFILSGTRTHLTNTLSNLVKTAFTPAYRVMGHLMPGSGFSLEQASRELTAFHAVGSNIKASWTYALKAFKESRNVLESGSAAWLDEAGGTVSRAWSKENVLGRHIKKRLDDGATMDEAMNIPAWKELQADIFDKVGYFLNTPSRFLRAEDEFFKQLNYRMDAKLHFQQLAQKRFGTTTSDEAMAFVSHQMNTLFDAAGGATNNDLLQFAKKQTWSQSLPDHSISKAIQDLSNAHPIIKVVLPFVRTPTNLLYDAIDHVPIVQRMSSRYKEAAKAGGRELAEMKGKAAMGGLIIAGTTILAAEGRITGSGPTDSKLREALLRTGWKPNSIRIGDSYYSYHRGDPFATLITATANFVEASPLLDEGQYVEMGTTLLAATMQLIGDKTYMKSMGDLVNCALGDDALATRFSRLGRDALTGFTSPNLLREARMLTNRLGDDVTRDVNTVWSNIAKNIPGWSSTLPVKHDWLTGQPWHPSLMGDVNTDSVARELASLGGVYKTPPYKFNNVELTEAQHSRYCELMGTVKIGGRNLHQALKNAIHSDGYDLKRKRVADRDSEERRTKLLNKIIERYRKTAGNALLREEQQLLEDVRTEKRNPTRKPKVIPKLPDTGHQLVSPSPAPTAKQQESIRQLVDMMR